MPRNRPEQRPQKEGFTPLTIPIASVNFPLFRFLPDSVYNPPSMRRFAIISARPGP